MLVIHAGEQPRESNGHEVLRTGECPASESFWAVLESRIQWIRSWAEPIACMWRFTESNRITEGFHRKMKLIQRRAYGFATSQTTKSACLPPADDPHNIIEQTSSPFSYV